MEVKEQIKRSVTITDVVSLYVDLRPAGKHLKALCPFHTEKTPSFYVMPEKDSFACYGCNKFGDIFTFIQEIENLSFLDAMNFLIDKFNIPIDRRKSSHTVKKDLYAGINELVLKYYRANLFDTPEGKKAQEYLKNRGIQPNTIDHFSLGYAPNGWDGLQNYLKKQAVDVQQSLDLGLLIKNDAGRVYDRFRGRIIFPIFAESGTVIAFGGRTIFDEPNKYLNSPDTPLYKKSNHLYGFNLTKNAIREKKFAILVEGYFDAVSLFQHGVENVVASLGTALTESQIYLLKRFSEQIYIFYDSDSAGVTAAVRGIEKMFEQNINPKILAPNDPKAKDPDDFIRAHGLKGFTQLLTEAVDGFRFLIGKIARKYDLKIPEQKNEAVHSIMGFVERIAEPIIRDEYTRMVADYFAVDSDVLKLKKASRAHEKNPPAATGNMLVVNPAERIFLECLLSAPELIGEMKEVVTNDILSVMVSQNIVRSLLGHFNPKTGGVDDYISIAAGFSDAERGLFREIFDGAKSNPATRHELEARVESSFLTFQDMLIKRHSHHIDQELKLAVRQNDLQLIQKLIQEKEKYIKIKVEKKQSLTLGGTVD